MKRAQVKRKTRPKKSVSFQDVARLAEVSTATVSRVARGNASVDEAMERRIREALTLDHHFGVAGFAHVAERNS